MVVSAMPRASMGGMDSSAGLPPGHGLPPLQEFVVVRRRISHLHLVRRRAPGFRAALHLRTSLGLRPGGGLRRSVVPAMAAPPALPGLRLLAPPPTVGRRPIPARKAGASRSDGGDSPRVAHPGVQGAGGRFVGRRPSPSRASGRSHGPDRLSCRGAGADRVRGDPPGHAQLLRGAPPGDDPSAHGCAQDETGKHSVSRPSRIRDFPEHPFHSIRCRRGGEASGHRAERLGPWGRLHPIRTRRPVHTHLAGSTHRWGPGAIAGPSHSGDTEPDRRIRHVQCSAESADAGRAAGHPGGTRPGDPPQSLGAQCSDAEGTHAPSGSSGPLPWRARRHSWELEPPTVLPASTQSTPREFMTGR